MGNSASDLESVVTPRRREEDHGGGKRFRFHGSLLVVVLLVAVLFLPGQASRAGGSQGVRSVAWTSTGCKGSRDVRLTDYTTSTNSGGPPSSSQAPSQQSQGQRRVGSL